MQLRAKPSWWPTSQANLLDPHAMDICTQERGLDGHIRAIQHGCINSWRRGHRCRTLMMDMLRTCSVMTVKEQLGNFIIAITVRMPAAVPSISVASKWFHLRCHMQATSLSALLHGNSVRALQSRRFPAMRVASLRLGIHIRGPNVNKVSSVLFAVNRCLDRTGSAL